MPRGILPVFGPLRVQRAPSSLSPSLSLGLLPRRSPQPRPCLFQHIRHIRPLISSSSLTPRSFLDSTRTAGGQGELQAPVLGAGLLLPVASKIEPRLGLTPPLAASILSNAGRIPLRIRPLTWRSIHTVSQPGRVGIRRVHQSSRPPRPPPPQRKPNEPLPENRSTDPANPSAPEHESIASSISNYLHLPHRPTKEELLAAANGFWERFKVRFKWLSIRSMRPWNADEWGAFVSWFILSHLVWILVGTTTFVSILIFSINTVFAQGSSFSVLFLFSPQVYKRHAN